MSNVEMLLVDALETAVEELSIGLEAKGFDFDVEDSPNTNQYMLIPTDDSQVIYVTAELSWDDEPTVFVDVYDVDENGEEQWDNGDMEIEEAISYLTKK
jgi:hypothetical protein|nr:MAG TPA: hypothetical protein [Caudoviricetes sp.]